MKCARPWLTISFGILVAGCASTPVNDAWSKIVIRPDAAYQPLLQGPPQTHGMRSGRVVLASGKAMERHSTEANEEQLLFLQGKGRVLLGKEEVVMSAGEVLYIPPHTEHEVHNDGPDELRYIYTVAPAP